MGWIIHKHKMSSFLAVYEAASFQRNMVFPIHESIILTRYVATPSLNETGLKEFNFFPNQTSYACLCLGDPKGLQQRVPLAQSLSGYMLNK